MEATYWQSLCKGAKALRDVLFSENQETQSVSLLQVFTQELFYIFLNRKRFIIRKPQSIISE